MTVPVPDGTTPPAEAVEAAMKAMLCRPGSVMSDPGDREYRLCISSAHGPALFGSGRCEFAEEIAADVVAALRLPERDRETAARFRVAAELTIQDVRAQRGDHIAGLVEDSFAAHFDRASALREGRDGRG